MSNIGLATRDDREKALQNDKKFFWNSFEKNRNNLGLKQVAERPEPKSDLALAKRTQEALQVLEIYLKCKIDGIIGVKTRVAI